MWFLNFIPDWITYSLFFIGVIFLVISIVLSYIPFVSTYKLPIQILSTICIIAGSFLSGSIMQENLIKEKIAELEIKIKVAEEKSAQENVKIVEKLVTETKVVKQKGADVIKYIDREVVKYDSECKIPLVVIKAHNAAAKNGEIK
jgi:flagellar motor component MotA